ncbi:MAG: C-GCAxxG-C-C family protein [Pseudomonadota bacterium]
MTADAEKKVAAIGELARIHFESRSYMCAESVLLALNSALGGGLTDAHAVALSAPFSEGMGGSGCTCGALSGAVLAIGLFTGNGEAYRHRRRSRKFANQFHGKFAERFGSACCRVLCRKVRHDTQLHFEHCAGITGEAARLAARLILEQRPDLAAASAAMVADVSRPSLVSALRRWLPWR